MLEQPPVRSNLIDVLDRVLDKGIVIDAWVRLSLMGVSLITVEARVIVASIETYLRHASDVNHLAPLVAAPAGPTYHRNMPLPSRQHRKLRRKIRT
jgi:hypothetical protein